jgi:sigma-B regulation protein RsbU (phosphoserine phosphatase)
MLRNRIALIFGCSAALLMAIVGLSLGLLWYWTELRLERALRDAGAAQWNWALERAAVPFEVVLIPFADDEKLAAAIGRDDRQVVKDLLREELRKSSQDRIARIDLVDADGNMIASTDDNSGASPLIDITKVNQVLDRGQSSVGVELGWDRRMWFVMTARGPARTTISAMQDLTQALPRLRIDNDTRMLLFDRDAKPVAATNSEFWPYVTSRWPSLGSGHIVRFSLDAKEYTAVPVDILNSAGSLVGTLAIILDRTVQHAQRRLIWTTGGILSLLCLAATIFFIYGYMRIVLDPLAELTRTIRALADGNLFAAPEVGAGRDEIGQIAGAVDVFRANAITLDRLQTREKLREAEQYRLIHREMARLAATLEEPARSEMKAELQRIQAARTKLDEGESTPATQSPLAAGFRHMANRVTEQHQRLSALLQERTRDLEVVRQALEERAQLTRLRQEMEVARDLQMASLPAAFPPFPERLDFEIFAAMQPAREVGGDFYDFALLDEDRLALFIGDASGKGVSAAMFVAMTRALLRSAVARGSPLPEALAIANDTLAVENDTNMFATAFIGAIDLGSGRLRYANAGHNIPYLVRGGRPLPLAGDTGIALGAFGGFEYQEAELILRPGDGLVLYSDGVTEAHNPTYTLFGDDRLESTLAEWGEASPEAVVRLIQKTVERFASGTEQADDITILAVRYVGPAAERATIAA